MAWQRRVGARPSASALFVENYGASWGLVGQLGEVANNAPRFCQPDDLSGLLDSEHGDRATPLHLEELLPKTRLGTDIANLDLV